MAGAVRGVLLLAQKQDIGTNHKRSVSELKRRKKDFLPIQIAKRTSRTVQTIMNRHQELPLVYRHELDEEPY